VSPFPSQHDQEHRLTANRQSDFAHANVPISLTAGIMDWWANPTTSQIAIYGDV